MPSCSLSVPLTPTSPLEINLWNDVIKECRSLTISGNTLHSQKHSPPQSTINTLEENGRPEEDGENKKGEGKGETAMGNQ